MSRQVRPDDLPRSPFYLLPAMAKPENPALARIGNAELIRQHFGYWPSFHDAEITKVIFEANPGYWPSATFSLNISTKKTHTLADAGSETNTSCTLELLFTDIQELEFADFSHQNVLYDLVIEESASNIKCTFDSSAGLDAVIVAREVRVLSLTSLAQ
ncbi:Imm50 family immunity protein [Hymenobacter fodinae]|uniref:Immunity protein 50 of polymorphic toxin system n=1 Tax=Hymenobacter fodinae TaxID=2510796 RepID=A0A4Z0P9U5_9BACT|nr:Imm50 family immunity protein [Hymenobacter fodinae]TGE09324.1 hypothetical protein EU556_00365 [Hymenobacter fodinae]